MNSAGHLIVSIAKSLIRIGSCALTFFHNSVLPMAVGFAAAEVLGILEELVDKR